MREKRPSGFHAFDHFERLIDSEVRWVRFVAERVENEDVQPFQQQPAFIGNVADIGAESDIAQPKTEYRQAAVQQTNGRHQLPQYRERFEADS